MDWTAELIPPDETPKHSVSLRADTVEKLDIIRAGVGKRTRVEVVTALIDHAYKAGLRLAEIKSAESTPDATVPVPE